MMPTGSKPFVKVMKNLYAVPTPLAAEDAPSKIEDFFDEATKATVIAWKTFNDGKGFDPDKHYGKTRFAHMVVEPNAANLNFSGFRPLLTNLVAAINNHKQALAPPAPGP